MARDLTERYQLAGFDACERGFNRPVDIEHVGDGYRAVFRYEAEFLATDEKVTREAALAELVRMLQARGYSQLRSQVSFKNGAYLGSQQPWVEHPDRTGGPSTPPDRWGCSDGYAGDSIRDSAIGGKLNTRSGPWRVVS